MTEENKPDLEDCINKINSQIEELNNYFIERIELKQFQNQNDH